MVVSQEEYERLLRGRAARPNLPPCLIYGAYGYTGRLIAQHAIERGLNVIVGGRDRERVERVAAELNCNSRVFAVDEAADLSDATALLNCAGPFSRTARPLMEACLKSNVHYQDITGEIDVIEAAAALNEQAKQAGITIMPAVGFDVVPSDCLAKKLANALPNADSLELAFSFSGSISRGTALTMWEQASSGGRARIDGKIVKVKQAWKVRDIPFKSKTRPAMTIPWGDVASAYYTTGIPNIAVFAALPRGQIRMAKWFGWMSKLSAVPPISSLGRWLIRRRFSGPDEAARQRGRVEFWGRAEKRDGAAVEAVMQTPEGYALTVQTAVECLRRVLAGEVSNGFHTPAGAFGGDFIERFPDVEFAWREESQVAGTGDCGRLEA